MAMGEYPGNTLDGIFDLSCSPCVEQNRNKEAVKYCVECQDYYCQSCTDMHGRFPTMRGHTLLDKIDFKSSKKQATLPAVPTERCSVHKTKVIDMYCQEHDTVCCTSCVAEKHRSCGNVIDTMATQVIEDTLTIKQPRNVKDTCTLYKAKKRESLNANIGPYSETCAIWGCCFIDDGSILLADFDNNTLTRVDRLANKQHCPMPDSPIAVCRVSRREAAVTLNNKSIQIVSLYNMQLDRLMKMNHHCLGIACNAGKMYVSDEGTKLYIYDMSGLLLRTVEKDSAGNDIFSRNRHVAIDMTEGRVYVADADRGLITLDALGNCIATFTDPELQWAQGVCSDEVGNVFVCGWKSNNVIQIGPDGQTLGEVLKASDGVTRPLALCVDATHKRLILTQMDTDHVYTFVLQ